MNKADWSIRANEYEGLFRDLARALGYPKRRNGFGRPTQEDHMAVQMMGTLAYGRHEAETGPQPTKESEIARSEWLRGYWSALKGWARVNDRSLQDRMLAMENAARSERYAHSTKGAGA